MKNFIILSQAFILLASLGLTSCNNGVTVDCTTNPELCATSSSSTIIPTSSSSTIALPVGANPIAADQIYVDWKTRYVEYQALVGGDIYTNDATQATTAGSARITWDIKTQTVSEGIGYGMLNAYFAADYDLMWQLFKYHKAMRYYSELMGWLTDRFGTIKSSGAATDADIDVATALLLSYQIYPDPSILSEALLIINDIWNSEIEAGNLLIRPGNLGWPATGQYNSSYFSPVAFRLFAKADPNHDWTGVLNNNYAYLQTVQANGNGLFADWTNSAGQPVIPSNNAKSTNYNRYGLESIRIPWRLAWDWYWFQDPRDKLMLDKMAYTMQAFIGGTNTNVPGNLNAIAIQYPFVLGDVPSDFLWNQQPIKPSTGIMASFCAAGVASPEAYGQFTTNCLNTLNSLSMPTQSYNYFHDILHVLYAQLLNGKYVKPAGL